MKTARHDGFLLFSLGSITFLLLGTTIANTSSIEMVDFRVLYYPARCLIHHGDPYNADQLLQMTVEDMGNTPQADTEAREVMRYIYFPTAFTITVPFALMPWGPAHLLWMALIVASLIFASFLMWSLASDYDPLISGALIGLFLFNSSLLVVAGNMAGVAISLCAIAIWCFVRERFVRWGIFCLATSLIVKPHDTGLVWLCFLLAGGVYRKRAVQTLLGATALSVPAVVAVFLIAPKWIYGLHANLIADAVHGGTNDPGLTSTGAHGLGMMVNLQTVFAALWDSPGFYNSATYLLFAILFLVWATKTAGPGLSIHRLWLSLAVVAPLTMMPFYHRQQDTRLLLIAVPACAMLWAKHDRGGRFAFYITLLAVALVGDIPWIIFFNLIAKLPLSPNWFTQHLLIAIQVFPVPLILLATCVFYLWLLVRHGRAERTDFSV